jgi:hypothetical protein
LVIWPNHFTWKMKQKLHLYVGQRNSSFPTYDSYNYVTNMKCSTWAPGVMWQISQWNSISSYTWWCTSGVTMVNVFHFTERLW